MSAAFWGFFMPGPEFWHPWSTLCQDLKQNIRLLGVGLDTLICFVRAVGVSGDLGASDNEGLGIGGPV
jgi:hypothetical protein